MRDWSIATQKFTGDEQGNVKQLHGVRVGPPPKFEPIAGTEFTLDADLVLLAMGFMGPVRNGMIEQLGVLARSARQCGDRRSVRHFGSGRVRGGRYAPRTVAGGVGDRRRPQGRRKCRHLSEERPHTAGNRGCQKRRESVAVKQTSVCFGTAPVQMSGGFQFQAVISAIPRHSPFKSFTLAAEPAVILGAHLDQSIQHVLSQYNDQLPLQEASTIPAPWYTDPRIAELERRTVFGANWQCVGAR